MREARLGDVVASMKNGLYKPASEYGDDGVPCLRMYNIDAGSIVWRDIKRMRVSASELEEYGLRDGDLLVNRVNSRELVGKTAYISASMEQSVFESNQRVCKITVDESLYLPRFLDYVLPGYLKAINDATSSVTVKHLSSRTIQDIPLPLPPMDEQREIVAELEKQFSRLDEAVANLKRVKANLKRYKAAVLKAAVEGRLVETEAERARREGRSYETGEQLLKRILETRRRQWQGKGKYKEPAAPDTTDLPELPEGWVWATVDELLGSLRNGLSRKPEDSEPGIPILRISAVRPLEMDDSDHRYYRTLPSERVDYYQLEVGDVLFVRYNGTKELVGACALVDMVPGCLVYPDKLIRGRVVSELSISPSYLAVAANVGWSRRHIDELIKTTAGQQGIAGGEIKQMPIPLPPIDEQHRIVAEVDCRLSILRGTEAQVDANLQRAERLRQSILSRAFSGNLFSLPDLMEAAA